ncbi:MAG: NAD(P)-dependent oxidoreductase [Candidatus Omnitrophica bacterium]|nr:NAD(P)-dependent oxidoreductase [Candidatus Omnitrophota bacterium]
MRKGRLLQENFRFYNELDLLADEEYFKMRHSVLVTGATGFIGNHLVGTLKEKGHSVYPLSKTLGFDVLKIESCSAFKDKGIDVVFHLAGETFVPDSWERPEDFYRTNIIGTQKMLDFCLKENARLIYVSGYIYGLPQYLPIDENHPVNPNNPYAHSKWQAEELCRLYAKNKGIKVTILRPFNIYGEGQNERFLIPSILKQIKEKGVIELKDAKPKRDYLYISDFIEACSLVVDHEYGFNIFNIGYGVSFSIREIAETIMECFEKKTECVFLGIERKHEIPETVADYKRINKALGWKPRFSFKEGISDILAIESRKG